MNFKMPIGRYNKLGRFNCIQWELLFKFFTGNIDSIIVYSHDKNELLNIKIPIEYENLNSIDCSECLYGFKILVANQTILDHFRDYEYSIDWGIQFMYMYRKGDLLSEFELDDSDNFVLLYLPLDEEKN
jgi:hypothetical protein